MTARKSVQPVHPLVQANRHIERAAPGVNRKNLAMVALNLNRPSADMDLDRNDPEKENKILEISIDVPGADYAGYYEKRDGGSDLQYLYLRKGSKVVYAYYSGKMKLMDKLQLFIDQLEAGENL